MMPWDRYCAWRFLGLDQRAVYCAAQRLQEDIGISWPVVVEVCWDVVKARRKADRLAQREGQNSVAVLLDYVEFDALAETPFYAALPKAIQGQLEQAVHQHQVNPAQSFGLLVFRYLYGKPLVQATHWVEDAQPWRAQPQDLVFATQGGQGYWVQNMAVALDHTERRDLLIQMAVEVMAHHDKGQCFGGLMSPAVLYDDSTRQLLLASLDEDLDDEMPIDGQAVDMLHLGQWLKRLLPDTGMKSIQRLVHACTGPVETRPSCRQFLRQLKLTQRREKLRQWVWPGLAVLMLLVSVWFMRHFWSDQTSMGLLRLSDDSKTYHAVPPAGEMGEAWGRDRHRVLARRVGPAQRVLQRRAPTLYERHQVAMMMAQMNRMRRAPNLDIIDKPSAVTFVLVRNHMAWIWVNDTWYGLGSFWGPQLFWSQLNVETFDSQTVIHGWLQSYGTGSDRRLSLGAFQPMQLPDGVLYRRDQLGQPLPAPVLSVTGDQVVYDFNTARRKRHMADPFVPQEVALDAIISTAAARPRSQEAETSFNLAGYGALYSREGRWWVVNTHLSRAVGQWLDPEHLFAGVAYFEFNEIYLRMAVFDIQAGLPLQRQIKTVKWPEPVEPQRGLAGVWFKFMDDASAQLAEPYLPENENQQAMADDASLALTIVTDTRFSLTERRRAAACLAQQKPPSRQPLALTDLHITDAENDAGHWVLSSSSGTRWRLGDWLNQTHFFVAVEQVAASRDLDVVLGQLTDEKLTKLRRGPFQTLQVDDKTTKYRRLNEKP